MSCAPRDLAIAVFALAAAAAGCDDAPAAGGVAGVVTLAGRSTGNAGILVTVSVGAAQALTDEAGAYAIAPLAPGSYLLTAARAGYAARSQTVEVSSGRTTQAPAIDLPLGVPMGEGIVSGRARLFDVPNAAGITVTLTGPGAPVSTATDALGAFSVSGLPPGLYAAEFVGPSGYEPVQVTNLMVAENSSVIPDVTLYRGSRVAKGNALQLLARSPDGARVLLSMNGVLHVVAQAGGAPVAVGTGTAALSGAFSPDGKTVALADGSLASPATRRLWFAAAGGATPAVQATGTFGGRLLWSPDGARAYFNANANGAASDWYAYDTVGRTTALAIAAATPRLPAARDGSQLLFSVVNGALFDLVLLDLASGMAPTLVAKISAANLAAALAIPAGADELLILNQSGTVGANLPGGDLFVFRYGTLAAQKLTSAPIESALDKTRVIRRAPHQFFVAHNRYTIGSNTVTGVTWLGGDTQPTAALRTLIANLPESGTPNTSLDARRVFALDRKTVSTRDLYEVDLERATARLVKPGVTPFNASVVSDTVSEYVRAVDATHAVYTSNTVGPFPAQADLGLWDGTTARTVGTQVQTEGFIGNGFENLQLSDDGTIAAYAGPTLTAVVVATTTRRNLAVAPQAFHLSRDGSLIAYAVTHVSGVLTEIKTVTTAAAPVTVNIGVSPTPLVADATEVYWLYLNPAKDLLLFGDFGNNAFRAPPTAAATITALGSFGVTDPRTDVFSAGDRILVWDEVAPGNLYQVDKATVAAATNPVTNTGPSRPFANRPSSMVLAFGDSGALTAQVVAFTGTGAPLTAGGLRFGPLGTLPNPVRSPDGNNVLFVGDNGAANDTVVLFQPGLKQVLATALDTRSGPSYALDATGAHLLFVDGTTLAVRMLSGVGPAAPPLATVLTTALPVGYALATIAPDPAAAAFASPGRALVYGRDGATLTAFHFPTSTVHTLTTGLVAGSAQFDPRLTALVYRTAPSTLSATAKVEASFFAAPAPVTLAGEVASFSFSPTGKALSGHRLLGGKTNLFAGLFAPSAAITTFGETDAATVERAFSVDESRLWALAGPGGRLYAATLGTVGLTVVDIGAVDMMPDQAGSRAITVARHADDPAPALYRTRAP